MSDWALLIIEGSAHLVNLESKITEIKDFGSFPTEIFHGHKLNTEFELFDKKAKIVAPVQSDFQSNLKKRPSDNFSQRYSMDSLQIRPFIRRNCY